MGLFDFLKDWKPKIKPEWKKKGWVDEKEFREYNFSPNMVKNSRRIRRRKENWIINLGI